MAENQIQSVTNKHEAIITFLVQNPEMKIGDVARHFKVTPSWMSVLLHSDAFKARLKDRQDQFFSAATVSTHEKLEALASTGVDKLQDQLENNADLPASEVREIVKMALDRLGYSNPLAPNMGHVGQQINVFTVDRDMLSAARERIMERRGTVLESTAIESLPETEGV